MFEFWYDYINEQYKCKPKLCYMDTDSFTIHTKTEDVYNDNANDVEKRLDTSKYSIKGPLPIGKNKKVIGLVKDELGGKIMKDCQNLDQKHILI